MKLKALLTSATALLAVGLIATPPAIAQTPATARTPNIVVIMGDDIGWFNVGYHQGIMSADAKPRQVCERGHALHRLCRGQLHGGLRQLHHRRLPIAASTSRRPGGLADRPCRVVTIATTLSDGICDRPARQDHLSAISTNSADRPRLRRVLRLSLSPRCDGRPSHRSTRRLMTRSDPATWSIAGRPPPTTPQ